MADMMGLVSDARVVRRCEDSRKNLEERKKEVEMLDDENDEKETKSHSIARRVEVAVLRVRTRILRTLLANDKSDLSVPGLPDFVASTQVRTVAHTTTYSRNRDSEGYAK
jgi:hypothetical protein